MAIILEIFSLKKSERDCFLKFNNKFCNNENSITKFEKNLPNIFFKSGGELYCKYCGYKKLS